MTDDHCLAEPAIKHPHVLIRLKGKFNGALDFKSIGREEIVFASGTNPCLLCDRYDGKKRPEEQRWLCGTLKCGQFLAIGNS